MKNRRIIDAWNKIEPNSTEQVRMLEAIIARNHSGQPEKEKVLTMNKTFNRKLLAPIAACLVLVVALTVVIGNNANWFNSGVRTVDLGSNGTLNFYKADMLGKSEFDFGVDVTSRDLTADENRILFGDLTATSYALFNSATESLLHVEGKIGDTKVLLAKSGTPITDVIIDVDKEVSEINGIPVSAGYFVTKENSKGIKNVIYIASFTLTDVSVYVELGGEETKSETLQTTIASVIEQLIHNGTPDFTQISK